MNHKEKCKEWYRKNRDYKIQKTREHQIRTNYATEKTPKQRNLRNIKRKTRHKYPLLNFKCCLCQARATERHHYSKPIKVDKFLFVCHKHHLYLDENPFVCKLILVKINIRKWLQKQLDNPIDYIIIRREENGE